MFKKLLKSTVAVVAAAAMTLGAASMASAAGENATLTIENPTAGSTYNAYTVMTAEKVGDNLYTYTVSDQLKPFFADQEAKGNFKLNADNEILVKHGDDWETLVGGDTDTYNPQDPADISKLASALDDYLNANTVVKTALKKDVGTLPIGYYLVTETMGAPAVGSAGSKDTNANGYIASRPILVNLTTDKTVKLKNDTVSLKKDIVENNAEKKENNVNIGDDVNYKVEADIPTFKANVDETKLVYEFTDTFCAGLTYKAGSLKVTVDGVDVTADLLTNTATPAANGETTLTVALKQATIKENQGKTVILTYQATLNDKAKVNSTEGNPNKITLKYNNNPNSITDVGYLNDEVKTFTYGFKLHKVDKNNDQADMEGTEFVIKNAAGAELVTYKFTAEGISVVRADSKVTIENGNIATITGLDAGTYTVEEKNPKSGYSKIPSFEVTIKDAGEEANGKANGVGIISVTQNGAPVKLEVEPGQTATKADNGEEILTVTSKGDGTIDLTALVENTKGISLPETGAKTAMYSMILGAILLLIGGLFYGISRKMSKKAAK